MSDIDIQKDPNGMYVAFGDGPMRPIIAEGVTEKDAIDQFNVVYGNQYAEQETLTALSLWR